MEITLPGKKITFRLKQLQGIRDYLYALFDLHDMLNIFKFFRSAPDRPEQTTTNDVKYLIAGLGNIGPDYENTRHNIGFMVVDELARRREITFQPTRYGDTAQFRFKGRIFTLLKPSTYMNLSGKAIDYWLKKEKVEITNLLVITDDVALPLGTLRLKGRGSEGGHNGLSNIISVLGTQDFPRLRFGIGNEYPKGMQVQFVLGKWQKEEMDIIEPLLARCSDLVLSFGTQGIDRTMNIYNTKQVKPAKKEKQPDGATQGKVNSDEQTHQS